MNNLHVLLFFSAEKDVFPPKAARRYLLAALRRDELKLFHGGLVDLCVLLDHLFAP